MMQSTQPVARGNGLGCLTKPGKSVIWLADSASYVRICNFIFVLDELIPKSNTTYFES